jgi:hypothetical protein
VSDKTATENTQVVELSVAAERPRTVVFAERAMWAWAAWNAVYGAYEALFARTTDMQSTLDMLGAANPVAPQSIRPLTAAVYALGALSIVWLAIKIGQRKRWARASLVANFVVQALWVSGSQAFADVLTNIPDLGLQMAALWFLYTQPARSWYARRT